MAVTLAPQFSDARDAEEESTEAPRLEDVAVDVNVHLIVPQCAAPVERRGPTETPLPSSCESPICEVLTNKPVDRDR